MEQILYRQISETLVRFMNKDLIINEAADIVAGLFRDEREAADDKLWDFECQQLKDLLWLSRTTGKPDMFSDELRCFWENGKPGNA